MTKIKIENHKHCNSCLNVLEEIGRFPWISIKGIIIIYQCDCGIWIDEENGEIREVYQLPIPKIPND